MAPLHVPIPWRAYPAAHQVASQRACHAPGRASSAVDSAACPTKTCRGSRASACPSLGQAACLPAGPRPRAVPGSGAYNQHRKFCSGNKAGRGRTCKRLGRKVRAARCPDRFLEGRAQEPFSRSHQLAGALFSSSENPRGRSPDTAGKRELPVHRTRDTSQATLRRVGRTPAHDADKPPYQPLEVAKGNHIIWPAARTGGAA